jgi:hypothetical protein
MIDFVQLQNDFAHCLLGDDWLRDVNIVTRYKLLLDDVKRPDRTLAAETLAYLTPRNGRKGCGVIVEVPEVNVASGNLPGPEMGLLISCLILEDPFINYGPASGTLRPADQVAQRIIEVGHGWPLMPHGELYAKGAVLVAARDFEPLRAYRIGLNLRMPRTQTTRVAEVTIAEDAGTVTLTVPSGATGYYTTDASFPGPGNPAATVYTAPFAVTAGTVLRWAAYEENKLPSAASHATVT